MIIACPACATRYAVPDTAIGIEGRMVRCAKCKHAWYQDGPETPPPPPAPPLAEPPPPVAAAPIPAAAQQTGVARPVQGEAAPSDDGWRAAPSPIPAAAPTAAAPIPAAPAPTPPLPAEAPTRPVYSDLPGDAQFASAPSTFVHEPPFRPRRNPARLWTMAAVIFALVALAAIGAVVRFGLPAWLPLSATTFAANQPDLVLDFPPNRQDRRSLPDGTQFFGVSGSITNVGKERHSVPPVLIVLRDGHNRIVYTFEVTPAKRVLAPGESEPVIEAVTDIPKSAKFAEIGWKPA